MSANADAGDRARGAERIGFIGLGIMGRPMARRLLDAGHPLTVHSRIAGPGGRARRGGRGAGGLRR